MAKKDTVPEAPPPAKPAADYDFDPRMIVDIAYGLEEADGIAERYGFVGRRWEKLKGSVPFTTALAQKVAELRASGYTFRAKCALAAESLLDTLVERARDPGIGTSTFLEIHRHLTAMGDLAPARDKTAGTGGGGGFVVNINLGDAPAPKSITVEGVSP